MTKRELGLRIAQRRREMQMSQEELAHQSSTSQTMISRYEKGEHEPSSMMLSAIADKLETTTDWLLGRTTIPERPIRGMGDLDQYETEMINIIRHKSQEQRQKLLEIAKVI